MKWQEFVLDKIAETKLFEMASHRSDAKKIVKSLSPNIIKHMIKIFVFESPTNTNHWSNEIDVWLNRIDEIGLKKSGSIDKNTLYNWLILDSEPHYDGAYVSKVVRKMTKVEYPDIKVRNFDPDEIASTVIGILTRVCSDIANDEFVTIKYYL